MGIWSMIILSDRTTDDIFPHELLYNGAPSVRNANSDKE